MSTLWVEEWQQVRPDVNGAIADVPHINVGKTQVSYTSSSERTSFAFDTKATYVIVRADADSYIEFGDSSVTAEQTGFILPAGVFRSFGLQGGWTHVAVVQKT